LALPLASPSPADYADPKNPSYELCKTPENKKYWYLGIIMRATSFTLLSRCASSDFLEEFLSSLFVSSFARFLPQNTRLPNVSHNQHKHSRRKADENAISCVTAFDARD
jgi:hypothetical protein